MALLKLVDAVFKDVSVREGIVTGYFSAFDNKDSDGDIIRKGAYAKTIQEQGPTSRAPRIKHLIDHDRNQVPGVLKVLKEDDFGLYYESKIGKHDLGVDFLKMADSGIITEHSVGIRTIKKQDNKEEKATDLIEVQMFEGSSLKCWGANSSTPLLSVKSEKDLLEMMDLLAKALRTGTYTDETFLQIEKGYKSIQAAVDELKKTSQPSSDTDPVKAASEVLKAFRESLTL
jgi:HK97 family phage prohead protease